MSEKYKKSMNKIIVSDELKSKILAAADKKITDKKSPKMFYIRSAAALAACVALFISVSNLSGFLKQQPQYSPTAPNSHTTENEKGKTENNVPEVTKPSVPEKSENVIQIPKETVPPVVETETKAPVLSAPPEQTETPDGEPAVTTPPTVLSEDLESILNELGYGFDVPSYIPDGYETKSTSLMFGSLVQIVYKNGDDDIIYRTEKSDAPDISGEYNIYENTGTQVINSNDVTLKISDGKVYTAVWNNGFAHSVYASGGLAEEEVVKIIEGIDKIEK